MSYELIKHENTTNLLCHHVQLIN